VREGARGKPRVRQSGGKPPHSKMGWAWMVSANANDRSAGSIKFKRAQLKSLCGNPRIFVGRGFSHDIYTAKSVRLQPLKYRFCGCHTDYQAGRYKFSGKFMDKNRRDAAA